MTTPLRPASVKTFNAEAWYHVLAIASATLAPAVAEITAGTTMDLSGVLFDDTAKPTLAQGRATRKRRLYDLKTYEQLGASAITGGTASYVIQPQAAAASDGKKTYEALAPGTTSFLVQRLGIAVPVTPVAGQFVNTFPVEWGDQFITPVGEGEGQEAGVQQDFAVTGPIAQNVAILA